MDQASNISDEAKANYDRASNEAKNAATLSMELREKLRQKDVEQKQSDWTYEFQRLNKTIKSSQEQIETLQKRKIKTEQELEKISNRPEEIAQRRGQLIETKGFAETERQFAADRLAEADN